MLGSIILSQLLKSRGEVLVAGVKCGDNGKIWYSYNSEKETYSFWEWSMFKKPILLDTDVPKTQAKFKLMLLGG